MRAVAASAAAMLIALASGDAAAAQDPPAKPSCLVSDVGQKPADPVPPLPEENVRHAIFVELAQVVARATREAAAAYPAAEGGALLSPTNVEKDGKLAGKRDAMERALERSYLPAALEKRSLVCAVAREVYRQGRDGRWPRQ